MTPEGYLKCRLGMSIIYIVSSYHYINITVIFPFRWFILVTLANMSLTKKNKRKKKNGKLEDLAASPKFGNVILEINLLPSCRNN